MGLPFITRSARKRDQIVAIDLGAQVTKAVYVQRRGESFNLLNYALLDTPTFEKSFSPDVLGEHFKSVARMLGCKSKQVNLALGVNDSVFRQVELPMIPIADMRLMLKFNSKNYLQQDLPDHVFDCSYTGAAPVLKPSETPKSGQQKHKVLIGATKAKTLNDVQAAFRTAGLVPDQVIPGVLGPVNAFEMAESETFSKEVVALVDLGFKNSNIIILDCGEIMLNRVVAIGGDRLTSGLAESMNISYQEAENIKVGMPNEVLQNLELLIHPLGRELRASIDFFETQNDKTVGKVYLSGGSAKGSLIVQALQTELMVTCQVWTPTRFMRMALPPEKMAEIEQIAPQLTVAIGAAACSF
jgi:type IV pilus assembly protein PilM